MNPVLAAALLAGAALAPAGGLADLDALDARVAGFTGFPAGQPGGAAMPLDRRLRLRACAGQPALAWHGAGRRTVLVQCPDPGGWRLYVPVAGGGAGGMDPAEAPVVNRGDAVTIAVSGAGFAVSQPGEAMEAGAPGAWIRVRPAGPARPGQPLSAMRARVVRPGLVAIPLP